MIIEEKKIEDAYLDCCPNCGGEASLIEVQDLYVSFYVRCDECGLRTVSQGFLTDAQRSWNVGKGLYISYLKRGDVE